MRDLENFYVELWFIVTIYHSVGLLFQT